MAYNAGVYDTMLIAGAGRGLIAALSNEAAGRGIKNAAAVIPGRDGRSVNQAGAAGGLVVSLDWNPGSPVSARSLVLAAENRIGTLGGAIIACSAPDAEESGDFSPAGIDALVNSHIKSYMFLARELIRHFQQKDGVLAFVLLETPPRGLLAAPVFGSFRSLAESLLGYPNTERLKITSFICDEKIPPPPEEFAAYIFKIINEDKKIDRVRFRFNKFKRISRL
ncbi:MAG: hypothetical protein LBH50_04440 [Spirochaetaceae bacterium]|jgi:NAD(P)-dependent dehydrogenase (short-subunit alcohol dehydrogenase family)|nr:hypothetical protein [Spirochaetaceae bacterium]